MSLYEVAHIPRHSQPCLEEGRKAIQELAGRGDSEFQLASEAGVLNGECAGGGRVSRYRGLVLKMPLEALPSLAFLHTTNDPDPASILMLGGAHSHARPTRDCR